MFQFAKDPRKWWLVALNLLGVFVTSVTQINVRDFLNSDGLSYLEVGAHTVEKGLGSLVHLYWSPLYPAMIAVGLSVFHPTPAHENQVVHVVNELIVLAASLACSWFIWMWFDANAEAWGVKGRGVLRFLVLSTFVYVLFLWSMYKLVYLPYVTPDILVIAISFAAAACCYRIGKKPEGRFQYAMLGVILGAGYLAKAAMLVIGALLLLLVWIRPPGRAVHRRNFTISAATFALVALPFIVALSLKAGKPTIGESGRLNLIWVNAGVGNFEGFTGEPPGNGTPLHPPRIISESPEVREFNAPFEATYPLWYDPAYWNAGLAAEVPLSTLWRHAIGRCHTAWEKLTSEWMLNWGFVVVVVMGAAFWKQRWIDWRQLWLPAWAAGTFAIYLPVTFETRYVAGAAVFLWCVAYGAAMGSRSARYQQFVVAAAAILLLAPLLRELPNQFASTKLILLGKVPPGWSIRAAAQLRQAGLRPGDHVATVGYSFQTDYLRMARVGIVAQVRDADEWWKLPAERMAPIEAALRKAGARAMVAAKKPESCACAEWRVVGETGVAIRYLDE